MSKKTYLAQRTVTLEVEWIDEIQAEDEDEAKKIMDELNVSEAKHQAIPKIIRWLESDVEESDYSSSLLGLKQEEMDV